MQNIDRRIIAGSALIIFAAAALFLFPGKPGVRDFEECAKAGYPIMESYPRQCRAPDGTAFAEDVSKGCIDSVQCPKGHYCGSGECVEFVPGTACSKDDDCRLINVERSFSCCHAGVCEPVDYSRAAWIAVNASWFEAGRAVNCPPPYQCGPTPLCPVRIVDDLFKASCIGGSCLKTARGAAGCQDMCGDGVCQEDVCGIVGCTCRETAESCPLDCNKTVPSTLAPRKRVHPVDYSCLGDADCEIKDVGNECGEYLLCVNAGYVPEAPELVSGVCGYPEIDGCRCMNKSCVGVAGGKASIN